MIHLGQFQLCFYKSVYQWDIHINDVVTAEIVKYSLSQSRCETIDYGSKQMTETIEGLLAMET